jgi:hypothetical protein
MTRRDWLSLAALAASTACHRAKGTGFPGYALVASAGDNAVSVVDLTAFRLQGMIPLKATPAAVAPAANPGEGLVLTPSDGSVHLIDERWNIARSRKFADELSALRTSSDLKTFFTVSASSRELIEADAVSLQAVRRHKLSIEPTHMDLSDHGFAAAASGSHGAVELINLKTGQHTRTHLSGEIGSIRFRGDGKMLLVANLREHSLTALEIPSLQIVADLALAMRPDNLCFNSDGGQLFVSGDGMDGVAIVFPYNIPEVEQTVLAGRDPGVMACSDKPALLFVASGSGSDVCILEITPRKVVGLVDVGQRATYIAITPDSQYALVLDEISGTMGVIHIPAIRIDPAIARSKSGASLFTMFSVGRKPVHAVVLRRAV